MQAKHNDQFASLDNFQKFNKSILKVIIKSLKKHATAARPSQRLRTIWLRFGVL
jgi:hypothetical protein